MKHTCSVTVRTYECDVYGHVNNAVYLNYLESARTAYLSAIGFPYTDFIATGYGLFVVRIAIAYRTPAVPGDVLTITTEPKEKKTASGSFHQLISRGNDIVADAEVTWACVGPNGRPSRFPEGFALIDHDDETIREYNSGPV